MHHVVKIVVINLFRADIWSENAVELERFLGVTVLDRSLSVENVPLATRLFLQRLLLVREWLQADRHMDVVVYGVRLVDRHEHLGRHHWLVDHPSLVQMCSFVYFYFQNLNLITYKTHKSLFK